MDNSKKSSGKFLANTYDKGIEEFVSVVDENQKVLGITQVILYPNLWVVYPSTSMKKMFTDNAITAISISVETNTSMAKNSAKRSVTNSIKLKTKSRSGQSKTSKKK